MSDEGEREAHFDLRVPERFREIIVPLLETLRRVAPGEVVPFASSRAMDPTDAETIEFAKELLSFALLKYGRGRQRSVPHCLAVHIFFQATHGRDELAKAIVEAANANSEVSGRFVAFFKDVGLPSDSWCAALDELIKKGRLKELNTVAQNRISVADAKYHFVSAFRVYLESRRSVDESQRERYIRWLLGLLPPLPYAEPPAEGRARSPLVPSVAPAWIKPLLFALTASGVVVGASITTHRCGFVSRRARAQTAPAQQAAYGEIAPKTAMSNSTPAKCTDLATGFDTKRCLIAEADHARADYARSAALYKQAIAFNYDPAGLGDRDEIPERYLNAWQSMNAYDGLASLQSENGRTREAVSAFRERLELRKRLRADGTLGLLLHSVDCSILVALERRANGARAAIDANSDCTSQAPYPSDVDTEFRAYELGLAYDDAGRPSDAAAAFAAVLGWKMEEPRGFQSRVWPGARWAHLVKDVPTTAEDIRKRFEAMLRLLPQGHSMVGHTLALWTESADANGNAVLGLMPLRIEPMDACVVDDPMNSDPQNVHKRWQVSVDTKGLAVPAKHAVPGLARNTPQPTLPWYGRLGRREGPLLLRVHISIALVQPKSYPAGCNDHDFKVNVCVFPDGRLGEGTGCE